MDTTGQPETFDKKNADGVGDLLKAARLNAGIELRDVVANLRISYAYIEAIENGRFEDLPGSTYSVGFVRAYAEYLGLESSEVVRRLKYQESSSDVRSELVFPNPLTEGSIPGGAIIFLGIIISLLAYGAWFVNSSNDGYFAHMIEPFPEGLLKPLELAKTINKTGFEKKSLAIDQPKTEANLEIQINEEIPKDNLKLPEKSEPTQQLKAEELPESVAELLTNTILARSKLPKKVAKKTVEYGLESTSAAVSKSTKEKILEPSLEPSFSQPSKLNTKRLNSPVPTLIPVIKAVVASRISPVVDSVRNLSVVPMDLITAAVSPSQPEYNLASNETQEPSTTKQELLVTSVIEDVADIVIKAKTTSWIQVRDDIANKIILTRLLREGDSYTVPARAGLMLSTGNAGALTISVDGEIVPPLGRVGDVLRTVQLEPAKLKAGTAVSK